MALRSPINVDPPRLGRTRNHHCPVSSSLPCVPPSVILPCLLKPSKGHTAGGRLAASRLASTTPPSPSPPRWVPPSAPLMQPKPAKPEPKRQHPPSAVRANSDDPPIHIRPIVPASAGARDKNPVGSQPLRPADHLTTFSRSQGISTQKASRVRR